MQGIIRLNKVGNVVHVWRADQSAVQAIRPRVIWALNRGEMSVFFFTESSSTVAAHVKKAMDFSAFITNNDQTFARYFPDKIIPGFGDLALMPDAYPLPGENLFLLSREDFRRHEILLRQRLRADCESFSGFSKCRRLCHWHQTKTIRIRKAGNKEGPIEYALRYITNSISYGPAFLIQSPLLDLWLPD